LLSYPPFHSPSEAPTTVYNDDSDHHRQQQQQQQQQEEEEEEEEGEAQEGPQIPSTSKTICYNNTINDKLLNYHPKSS
jgi:hypothetical protein